MNHHILSKRFDINFIILPGILSVFFVIIGNNFDFFSHEMNPIWWLALVAFLDVGHVWSTLFRTYFHKNASQEFKAELILIPIIAWVLGVISYHLGEHIFWRLMAYLALFHFIKQQIGILKLYLRGREGFWSRDFDVFTLYVLMLVPVIHWHLNSKSFNWFRPGDFFSIEGGPLEPFFWVIYILTVIMFATKEIFIKEKVNFLKIGHMISTALVWAVGIVAFDNDWSFTLTNIVHHGVPYLALIWVSTCRGNYESSFSLMTKILKKIKRLRIVFFILFLFSLGYAEEFLWDFFVWHEHGSLFIESGHWVLSQLELGLIVPILAVPQITHYVLDGQIWKRERKVDGFYF